MRSTHALYSTRLASTVIINEAVPITKNWDCQAKPFLGNSQWQKLQLLHQLQCVCSKKC